MNLDTVQRIRAGSARRACLAANPVKSDGPDAGRFGELRHHHPGVATTLGHERPLRLVFRVSLLDFSYRKYAAKLGNKQTTFAATRARGSPRVE